MEKPMIVKRTFYASVSRPEETTLGVTVELNAELATLPEMSRKQVEQLRDELTESLMMWPGIKRVKT